MADCDQSAVAGRGDDAPEPSRVLTRKAPVVSEYEAEKAMVGMIQKDAPDTASEALSGKWFKNRRKVTYGLLTPDDPENSTAFEEHARGYRGIRRRVKDPYVKAGEAYCHRSNWLRARRSHDAPECLLPPWAHPGFVARVRFNFREVNASRAMCILAHGTPPFSGAMAIHSCGNGHLSCVNPAHLRWGTAKDNSNDAWLHHGPEQGGDVQKDVHIHPLPKVAAVETGMTAKTIRKARAKP